MNCEEVMKTEAQRDATRMVMPLATAIALGLMAPYAPEPSPLETPLRPGRSYKHKTRAKRAKCSKRGKR